MMIVIATTNIHKVEEISRIFNFPGLYIKSLKQFPGISPAVENGTTFRENAELKARHYFQHLKKPVIADDSGLVVPALKGEPGIHSARYAGEKASYAENNQRLLQKMTDLADVQRDAYFVCVVVFYDGRKILSAEGRAEGRILREEKGSEGFGYDPLFYYPPVKKTFAELTAEEKNSISHRSQALWKLKEKLAEIVDNNS